jgi:hypothetical protein
LVPVLQPLTTLCDLLHVRGGAWVCVEEGALLFFEKVSSIVGADSDCIH